jgi:hypothetical protein
MELSIDNIIVKHWGRKNAALTKTYLDKIPVVYVDLCMHYLRLNRSIHYDSIVRNDYSVYNEYITTTNQKEHSELQFKTLLKEWDVTKMEKIKFGFDNNIMCIIDGVHRASIYIYASGKKGIPVKYVNITYPDDVLSEISNALIKTTTTHHYNGWSNKRAPHGYHSFNLFNINFEGQRNPKMRLDIMRKHYKFDDKYIIDLGCNTGGMLFHCLEMKKGHGFDFDKFCIDACNTIKNKMQIYDAINFSQIDLDKEDQATIFSNGRADVVFLLSLGSWIKKWSDLYKLVIDNTDTIFLETNNDEEGKPQLLLFETHGCKIEMIAESSKDDITKNNLRKMYKITTPVCKTV